MKKIARKSLNDEQMRKFLTGELVESTTSNSVNNSDDLLSQLTEIKEPTIRLTVDLPISMHQKLSQIAYETGRKKAVIIRFLINQAFSKLS